ncbi:PDZ domain-containing protein [Marinicella sediminis]|uniref:PDZ domain-containing protein n=1 Tax=Marinicella sediminis TaxID=1792834 RepID=A0ABV7J9M9_9GAMM|nr:PDZ domain-containing protein [Marinicella sediminis]
MNITTQWNLEVEKSSGSVNNDPQKHQMLVKVAPGSPADELGLSSGDLLISVNGAPANEVDVLGTLVQTNVMTYEFYQPQSQSMLCVEANNMPLGFVVEGQSEGITQLYEQRGMYDWSDLMKLWERGEWTLLARASQAVHQTGLLNRLIRLFKPSHQASGAVLLMGAAMYEQGQPAEGMNWIELFIDELFAGFTTDYHAVAFYYKARWAKESGDSDEFIHWLERANHSNAGRSARVNELIRTVEQIELSHEHPWLGMDFPSRFVLPLLEQEGLLSLQNMLDGMQDDQLLPVCVMPSYRGNGPYNDSMLCYRATIKHLAEQFLPMVVITDQPHKRPDRMWWYEHETKARQQHIELHLVYDETASVARQLDMQRTPIFYVLNKQSTIIHQGALDEPYDYWCCLSQDAV